MASEPLTHYDIRVRGALSERMACAFPALTVVSSGQESVLSGLLPDQAALFGVLAQVEALGIELLEVRSAGPRRRSSSSSS